jgi:hypothetical protein
VKYEPDYEVPPPMWCTGDLVILKNNDQNRLTGTIVDTSRTWINHVGAVWSYKVLVMGKIVTIDETCYSGYKILRRISDTSEGFWERVEKTSKKVI